ncbi:TIP-1 family-domain-containing protein, partial [Chlamydoabsidia padenii]
LEQKLRILDSATSYIKTLHVATHLWTESLKNVESNHSMAVQKYIQLLKFNQMICAQEPVQRGSFVDLGVYLEKCQMELWNKLNKAITMDFQSSLKTLDWPNALHPPYGPQIKAKLERLETGFRHLLLLEHPTEWNKSPDQRTQSAIISPIQLLLEPISLRFKFHFEGSRPTNRMDKPEWYLKHVNNQISSHIPFIMTTIQPIVNSVYNQRVSAKDYFINGLLVDVARKVKRTLPKLITQPNLLSHTIHQLLLFEQSLRDDFGFTPPGIKQDTLDQVSQARYDDIASDKQAFDLYEGDQYMDTEEKTLVEATHSSMKLIHLWEGVTDTYRLVPSTRQKFHFFAYIQLSLLGQYHYRISSAVDSFEALSLIRSVQVPGALPDAVTGVTTATESGGSVSVLKKLYRWWTSTQKMIETIRDWEDDEFFMDLNQEINQDPEIAKDVRKNLFAQDKVCYVVDPSLDQEHKGLFGDIYGGYQQLADRIQKICEKIVIKEWTVDAKQYAKRDIWWQTINDSTTPLDVLDSLYRPLQSLLVSCKYLHKTYPQSNFLSMYKHISLGIEDWYWRNIVTKNQFSPSGVQQLETDLRSGLWKIGKRLVNKPENYTRRLKEALQVFTLPMSSSAPKSNASCDHLMKLLVDQDQHAQAQVILDTLGIDTLTITEIRDVLRRRNDMLNSWS